MPGAALRTLRPAESDPAFGPPDGDMPADDRQTLTGYLANQRLQTFVCFCPLLYLRHQIAGHIDRSGLTVLCKSKLPGRRLAPRPLDLTQRPFDKGSKFPELPSIGIPKPMVPAIAGVFCFHVAKCISLAI